MLSYQKVFVNGFKKRRKLFGIPKRVENVAEIYNNQTSFLGILLEWRT